jgi:hypothetical protein
MLQADGYSNITVLVTHSRRLSWGKWRKCFEILAKKDWTDICEVDVINYAVSI